jgi:hypothetical protein
MTLRKSKDGPRAARCRGLTGLAPRLGVFALALLPRAAVGQAAGGSPAEVAPPAAPAGTSPAEGAAAAAPAVRPARPLKKPPIPEPSGRDVSLRDLGFTRHINVKGVFPTQIFRFAKPEHATTLGPGSHLKLRVQHSSALRPESTMTVLVDELPVFSRFLNVPREAWFDVQVNLADLRLRDDQPHVQVEIRFFNVVGEDPCADLSNPAIWAAIHLDSLLHVGAAEAEPALGLSTVRSLYADRRGPGVTVVLPDRLEADEVPAAVWLVSWLHGLAEASGAGDRLAIVRRTRFARSAPTESHVVFLGTIAGLADYLLETPALGQRYGAEFNSLFDQAADLHPGDALLLVGGTARASHLFVTGRDGPGLRQAARAITSAERGPLTGRELLVRRLRVKGPPGLRVPPYQVSLRRLGYVDQQVRGVAKHTLRMTFKRADLGPNVGGVSFTAGGTHSAFLGEGSTMSVLFNQVPIQSVPLMGSSDRFSAVRAELPEDLMTPGTNTLEVAFDLLVPTRDCTRVWYEQAWASLSADSYFEVSATRPFSAADLDFRTFPEPFLFDCGIVLPEDTDDWELRAAAWMLSAMEGMGGTSFNPFTKVFTYGEWRQGSRDVRNLIAIAATRERMGDFRALVRPSLQVRGRHLDLVTVQGETIYSARTGDPLGMAQLFPNPASAGSGAILLVTATLAPNMLVEVARAFADENRLRGVRGNVVLVDADARLHSYDVGTEVAERGADAAPTWYAGVVKYRSYLLTPGLMLLALLLATAYRKTRGAAEAERDGQETGRTP